MTNPSYHTAYEAYLAHIAESASLEDDALEAAGPDDAEAEIERQSAQVISIAKCPLCGFSLDVTPWPDRTHVTCRNCGARREVSR